MDSYEIVYLVSLSFIAGLATFIGAFIGVKTGNGKKSMVFGISFSAAIMLLISFAELLPESINKVGLSIAVLSFFVGVLILAFLDHQLPHIHSVEEIKTKRKKSLARLCYCLAFGLILHDFPEGLAIPSAYLVSKTSGMIVIIASFLHNIPEGYALSAASSGLESKKFFYRAAMFSSLATVLGTIAGIYFLRLYSSLGPILMSATAGIMVYISLNELLPFAIKCKAPKEIFLGVLIAILTFSGLVIAFS